MICEQSRCMAGDGRPLMSLNMAPPVQKWVPVKVAERRWLLKKTAIDSSLVGSANPAEDRKMAKSTSDSSLASGSAKPAVEKVKKSSRKSLTAWSTNPAEEKTKKRASEREEKTKKRAIESSQVQSVESPAAEKKMDMSWSATKKRKAPPSAGKSRSRSGSESKKGMSRDPREGDEEIKQLFDRHNTKKKKHEEGRSQAEIASVVEQVIAELEVAAEEDAELNRPHKPAICKLMKLSLLTESLSMTKLKGEFLDHGVLAVLKTWLEPLPDGSLPNTAVRTAVLEALSGLGMDLDQWDRREQLRKSGVGKVVMFFSRSDEETASNRRRAKELVHTWSRPIFGSSARFEDLRRSDAGEQTLCAQKKAQALDQSLDADLNRDIFPLGGGTSKQAGDGASNSMQHASRPEASSLGFAVRPPSKVDPERVRAQVKLRVCGQHREMISKKLQMLKATNKKPLHAAKGRTSTFCF